MYADEIALLAVACLKAAIELLDTVFSDWGLTVSTSKTQISVIGTLTLRQPLWTSNCAVQ